MILLITTKLRNKSENIFKDRIKPHLADHEQQHLLTEISEFVYYELHSPQRQPNMNTHLKERKLLRISNIKLLQFKNTNTTALKF